MPCALNTSSHRVSPARPGPLHLEWNEKLQLHLWLWDKDWQMELLFRLSLTLWEMGPHPVSWMRWMIKKGLG